MRLIDGMHRLRAAQLRGETEIEARLFDGDEVSCFVLAVKCNVAHGLPLTLADRKIAADRIIRLYPQWSDRMVASITGIAPGTVSSVRALRNARAIHPSAHDDQLDARVGRDGRRRPQNSQYRRELAANFVRENPNATLRQIAEKAGISPETARSVREQVTAMGRKPTSETREIAEAGRPSAREKRRRALTFLRADPAFRSTESGRLLLRLLGFSELRERLNGDLTSQIAPHCLDAVAEAAAECSDAWRDFAAEIKSARAGGYEKLKAIAVHP